MAFSSKSYLVISLLRIGDVLQHLLIYRQLRTAHPGEYFILIDEEFSGLTEILQAEGLSVILFPRKNLRVLGNKARTEDLQMNPQFQDWLLELHNECGSLDGIFNLTHTVTSAYIAGELFANFRKGLSYGKARFQGLDSKSSQYFNDRFSMSGQSCFHYIEAISMSLDIEPPKKKPAKGNPTGPIYFQTETSDVKKNWPTTDFKILFEKIKNQYPNQEVKVLASASSEAAVKKTFGEDSALVCSLSEARTLLSKARALITLDTSIKHLAVLENCPVIEICVGSADWHKTGAYQEGGVALQADVDCHPCVHSKACPQSSFLCHQSVSAEKVFVATRDFLEAGKTDLPQLPALERAYWRRVFATDDSEVESFIGENQRLTDKALELVQLKSLWPNSAFFEDKKSLQAEDLKDFIYKLKTVKDRWGLFLPIKNAIASGFNTSTELNLRMTDVFSMVREDIETRQNLADRQGRDSRSKEISR